MKKIIIILLVLWGLVACKKDSPPADITDNITFIKPENFPEPVYNLSKNPVTPDGFKLGRLLFYDGILSRDGSIACGSCHIQGAAFTHHFHDVSHGIEDRLGTRNAPSLQNMAWQKTFFWDGGVHDLDLFSIAPIENEVEMDESFGNVLEKIRNDANYPALFKAAFGTEDVTSERFLKAISQFLVMLISANSRYDQYKRGETTLAADELEGLALFEQKCSTCHKGELFTDLSFRNNGLAINEYNDLGRYNITLLDEDKYKFKVPSLRNVAYTFPYMHDGRFYSLEQVLNHYQGGVQEIPNLDPLLSNGNTPGISLTQEEKNKIIAFLKTLTDEEFLRDKRFAETNSNITK